jgi:hypothetical protein
MYLIAISRIVARPGFYRRKIRSRYKGIDRKDAGNSPDFNAELTSWLHSFTPAINMYIRNTLNYKTDFKYNMFGPVRPWDNSNDATGENLRQAMAQNPYLNVMVQSDIMMVPVIILMQNTIYKWIPAS